MSSTDVVLTSMRRDDVASTLAQRQFDVMRPLGRRYFLLISEYQI